MSATNAVSMPDITPTNSRSPSALSVDCGVSGEISTFESSMYGCGNRMVVRTGRPGNGLTRKGGYFLYAGRGRYSSVNT